MVCRWCYAGNSADQFESCLLDNHVRELEDMLPVSDGDLEEARKVCRKVILEFPKNPPTDTFQQE